MLSPDTRHALIRRLRRIEGQTQGIQRMLADGRDCADILDQLASVRAATQRVSMELMKHHILSCVDASDGLKSEKAVDDMLKLLVRT